MKATQQQLNLNQHAISTCVVRRLRRSIFVPGCETL